MATGGFLPGAPLFDRRACVLARSRDLGDGPPMALHTPSRVVLHLHGESFARRYQVVSHAITAAVAGDDVKVVLWFDGLVRWIDGTFDQPNHGEDEAIAGRHRALNLPPPSEMLAEARLLGARLLACETAVRLAGLDPERVASKVDGLPGLQEIHELAKEASVVLYV